MPVWSCVLTLAGVPGPSSGRQQTSLEHGSTWFLHPPPSPWALWPVLLIFILLSRMYWCADLILDISRSHAESEIGKVAIPQLVQAKGRHA